MASSSGDSLFRSDRYFANSACTTAQFAKRFSRQIHDDPLIVRRVDDSSRTRQRRVKNVVYSRIVSSSRQLSFRGVETAEPRGILQAIVRLPQLGLIFPLLISHMHVHAHAHAHVDGRVAKGLIDRERGTRLHTLVGFYSSAV